MITQSLKLEDCPFFKRTVAKRVNIRFGSNTPSPQDMSARRSIIILVRRLDASDMQTRISVALHLLKQWLTLGVKYAYSCTNTS